MSNSNHQQSVLVVYEDNEIIVAEKPSGIPSVETLDPKRAHFYGMVKNFLSKREGREIYLAAHHRLDVGTSGLILFVKKKSMNKAFSDLFSQRQIEKTYLAKCLILNSPLEKTKWREESFLKKTVQNKLLLMETVKSGGEKAITFFNVLSQKDNFVIIEAKPKTGRMHQIRVHLAEKGLPILGDNTYLSKNVEHLSKRLMLHAHELKFTHPKTLQPVLIQSANTTDLFKL